MCKKFLRENQMSSAALVEEAAHWAKAIVDREARCPGDLRNAMSRVARRNGLSVNLLWSLRYRKPKDILASAYFSLRSAYEAECERQLRLLKHELQETMSSASVDERLVREIQALVGSSDPSNLTHPQQEMRNAPRTSIIDP